MRSKPDFIIIGVQKGGTSSLFDYLGQHPVIDPPKAKELHFFDLNYRLGIRHYREQFPAKPWLKKSVTGEASPYYIFHPLAPGRIKSHFPGIKLIVLLRDPVARAYSHYQMQKKKGIEELGFRMAAERDLRTTPAELHKITSDESYNSAFHQKFTYLSRGHYYEQIMHWLAYFRKDQFLFIKSEDFFEDPQAELRSVYAFLGIKEIYPPDLSPKNTGSYHQIQDNDLRFLVEYYREKNLLLPDLIGGKFQW